MKEIYKYQLQIADGEQSVVMPEGSKVLTAHVQRNGAYVWALVNSDEKRIEVHKFRLLPTGYGIPDYEAKDLQYVGTIFISMFVWHVFEIKDTIKYTV